MRTLSSPCSNPFNPSLDSLPLHTGVDGVIVDSSNYMKRDAGRWPPPTFVHPSHPPSQLCFHSAVVSIVANVSRWRKMQSLRLLRHSRAFQLWFHRVVVVVFPHQARCDPCVSSVILTFPRCVFILSCICCCQGYIPKQDKNLESWSFLTLPRSLFRFAVVNIVSHRQPKCNRLRWCTWLTTTTHPSVYSYIVTMLLAVAPAKTSNSS